MPLSAQIAGFSMQCKIFPFINIVPAYTYMYMLYIHQDILAGVIIKSLYGIYFFFFTTSPLLCDFKKMDDVKTFFNLIGWNVIFSSMKNNNKYG